MTEQELFGKKFWIFLEWVALIIALIIITTREEYHPSIWFALGLLVVAHLSRLVSSARLFSETGLELPWLLFIGSAAQATWIAYNIELAFLQFSRILAAATLFYSVCILEQRYLNWAAIGLVVLCVLLAIYWPLQHDFTSHPVKFNSFQNFGLWINSNLPQIRFQSITGPEIHPNVAAGSLALGMPFVLYFVYSSLTRNKWIPRLLSVIAFFLIIFCVFLTSARGAWLAIGGTIFLFGLAYIQRKRFLSPKAMRLYWAIVFLAIIIIGIYLLIAVEFEQVLGVIPGPINTVLHRTRMWKHGIGLIRDYFYTGSGLQTFWMVYSTYSILIHVPFVAHVHNTFLEVWIEQGVIGVIALIFLAVVVFQWIWHSLSVKTNSAWGVVGVSALMIVTFQSLFDVLFYVERTLPLIGLVLGFTYQLAHSSRRAFVFFSWSSRKRAWLIGGTFVSILALFLSKDFLISTWHSNIAALEQTRLELSRYDPQTFDKASLDSIRQEYDLRAVELYYQKALSIYEDNLTARQRLAEIALSKAEYSWAFALISPAWNAGHLDDTTRLLYGDVLVALGKPEEAAVITRSIPWAEGRLMQQAWYRYWLDGDYVRSLYAWQSVLFLNPDNEKAAEGVQEAQNKIQTLPE